MARPERPRRRRRTGRAATGAGQASALRSPGPGARGKIVAGCGGAGSQVEGAPRRGVGRRPGADEVRELPVTDYAAIFRAMPTPYLVMTPDLVIADANAAYLRTTGRTLEDIVGRPVFEAFPGNPNERDPDGGRS